MAMYKKFLIIIEKVKVTSCLYYLVANGEWWVNIFKYTLMDGYKIKSRRFKPTYSYTRWEEIKMSTGTITKQSVISNIGYSQTFKTMESLWKKIWDTAGKLKSSLYYIFWNFVIVENWYCRVPCELYYHVSVTQNKRNSFQKLIPSCPSWGREQEETPEQE